MIDGQENPIVGVIIPYKLWELGQRYLTVWNYVIEEDRGVAWPS